MNIIKQLLLFFSIGFCLVGNAIAEEIPRFENLPRAQVFELALQKSGVTGDSARSYIMSQQGRMAPYLLAVAGDPKFKHRQFAIDLLLNYPYRGNWNEPLEQLYSSDDSALWKPALEKRIKFVLEGAKLVHRIGFPDHWGYPLAKHIYFLERCAGLIDAGISNHTYGLQTAITDTLPAVNYAALSAVSQLTRYHYHISSAILSALSRSDDPTYRRKLHDIICEKPFLVLPELLNYKEESYYWSAKMPAGQYLNDIDLSAPKMVEMLVWILQDTTGRDKWGIISHQQNAIRAIGRLGRDAKSARSTIEPFLSYEDNQLKPYAVLTMSRIDPDYPKLVQMIGLGLLGIEAREKWEAERKKWEEEAANSESEGDECGGEYTGFEEGYKSARLVYIEAAKNLGMKAQDCGWALAMAMNEGCFDEAYPVLYSFGEAGMQAFTQLIFRCPNVWSHRDEMRALMHNMQPETVLIKQMIDDALTSPQLIGTKWSLVPPLRAARAMGFPDSMVVSAVGSLFTPKGFIVENEISTATSYLAEVGSAAKYAHRGIACAFLYPDHRNKPATTRLILSLGKDAEPVVRSIADLLDSGLVAPASSNGVFSSNTREDFYDIIYTVGESTTPHLVRLASSDSMDISGVGFSGLGALNRRAVSAMYPIYRMAKESDGWRRNRAFGFFVSLDELAWPVFRDVLTGSDQNMTATAIHYVDSLYANANEVVQDSVRTLLEEIWAKGNAPVNRTAWNKLAEIEESRK